MYPLSFPIWIRDRYSIIAGNASNTDYRHKMVNTSVKGMRHGGTCEWEATLVAKLRQKFSNYHVNQHSINVFISRGVGAVSLFSINRIKPLWRFNHFTETVARIKIHQVGNTYPKRMIHWLPMLGPPMAVKTLIGYSEKQSLVINLSLCNRWLRTQPRPLCVASNHRVRRSRDYIKEWLNMIG